MDDFNLTTLNEARNEYCLELIGRLTPLVYQGILSIFEDAYQLCVQNDQVDKYLMTFQNYLARVPKWNHEIIEMETQRIIKETQCPYLEELMTCVHIIMLKNLTAIRAGTKNKKVDVDIPNLDDFIHKIYIEVARRIYKNVYLFDRNVKALEKQKNMRECELIIRESIVNVIRKSMPIERIIRAYLDETTEEQVVQVKEEIQDMSGGGVVPEKKPEMKPVNKIEVSKVQQENKVEEPVEAPVEENTIVEPSNVRFNDKDVVLDFKTQQKVSTLQKAKPEEVYAPKDVERLEELNRQREQERPPIEDEDDQEERIQILDEPADLDEVEELVPEKKQEEDDLELDIETL
jgi:hypothetical protein